MANLLVDDRDQKFALFEQFEIGKFSESERFADFDVDTYNMVLSEAKKLAENETMPTNTIGDTEGVVFKDGKVFVPKEFHRLWQLWNEGGWRGLDIPQECGGQGMPMVLGMAANEYFEAANLAFQMFVAMPRGVAYLIASHGTEEQRRKYGGKVLSGEWTATMALTEPEAGSDVGATKTTAEKNADGTYKITGGKSFISGGSSDFAENIIHLALARVKGAPAGTKGLSLFIVPVNKVNTDGSMGGSNDVKCVGVEHKMGIKASATCLLSFGEENNCTGELIGKENEGMAIFFTMLNESRLIAARHGASVASSAYLHAYAYSKERLQGNEIGKGPEAGQCPIIKHPDIRRMLLLMKSYTEGIRALIYYTAYSIDRADLEKSKEEKKEWESRTGFLTPVAKSYAADMSFRVTETAMQVYGGYGYMKDYPIEQFLRDEKIHSIFEGTNGIQALDLTGRKLGRDGEYLFRGHLGDITKFCERHKNHPTLAPYIKILKDGNDALIDVSKFMIKLHKEDFKTMALYAVQYQELFGDVTVGWLLLWQARIAYEKLVKLAEEKGLSGADGIAKLVGENTNAAFYSGKLASAKYFLSNVVILASAKADVIKYADKAALDIAEDAFAF